MYQWKIPFFVVRRHNLLITNVHQYLQILVRSSALIGFFYTDSNENVKRGNMKGFSGSLPNKALRFFGVHHMFWGITILILSFVQLGITSRDIDEIWNPEKQDPAQPNRYTLYTYYPIVAIVFCSLMVTYSSCSNSKSTKSLP